MTSSSLAGERSSRTRHHKKRIPFDASRISPPVGAAITSTSATTPSDPVVFEGLGFVPIDRIQLCEMGSSDAEGAYRAIAEMKIWPTS